MRRSSGKGRNGRRHRIGAAVLAGLCVIAAIGARAEEPRKAGGLKWSTDLDPALRQARAEEKKALVNFTGLGWCPFCIRLEREALRTKEFVAFASKRFVPVVVDFRKRPPLPRNEALKNRKLMKKYGITGFPTLLVLDSSGKAIGRQAGYSGGGAAAVIRKLSRIVEKPSSGG